MEFTDIEIIEAIKSGQSKDVLNYLYKTIRPQIKSWILKNNGNDDEAQDVFQDAVISFYKYVMLGKFKIENSVGGFIFSISRNLWINRAKQKNKFVGNIDYYENEIISDDDNYLHQKITSERASKIQEILTQLGEKCKELLTFKIFHQLSMEEISVKMGFSNADTAKTKHYKCKQRLINLVKENAHLTEFLKA